MQFLYWAAPGILLIPAPSLIHYQVRTLVCRLLCLPCWSSPVWRSALQSSSETGANLRVPGDPLWHMYMSLIRKCTSYHRLGNIPFGVGGWGGKGRKERRVFWPLLLFPLAGCDTTQKKQGFLLTQTAGSQPTTQRAWPPADSGEMGIPEGPVCLGCYH